MKFSHLVMVFLFGLAISLGISKMMTERLKSSCDAIALNHQFQRLHADIGFISTDRILEQLKAAEQQIASFETIPKEDKLALRSELQRLVAEGEMHREGSISILEDKNGMANQINETCNEAEDLNFKIAFFDLLLAYLLAIATFFFGIYFERSKS